MEKRLAAAIGLCVAFMIFWTWLFPPAKSRAPQTPPAGQEAAAPPDATAAASGGPAQAMTAGGNAAATPAPAPSGAVDQTAPGRAGFLPPQATQASPQEEIAIDTPLVAIRLASRGARVISWRLLKFRDARGELLDLVSPAARKLDRMPLDLHLEDPGADERVRGAAFEVLRDERQEEGRTATVVTLTWSDGAGNSAAKVLTVLHDGYIVDFKAAAEVGGRPIEPGVTWGAGFENDEDVVSERMSVGARAVVDLDGKVQQRYQTTLKPEAPWSASGAVGWAGLESKYFAAILVPQAATSSSMRAEVLRLVEEGREQLHLSLTLLSPGASGYRLFAGPKDYDVLKGTGLGLEKLLDFGLFGIIALPLFSALKFVHRYVGNYGVAIIILTVVIRLLFFPFMHRSQLKMRLMQEKMKRIQPKLKSLKERYQKLERKEVGKGTVGARQKLRQQQNEEMMELYREEGINPFSSMSGCLPLLAQMPILYAFYTILTIAIELRHAPFTLWVRDLSVMDPYYVTPILMGGTMLVQQVMTSSAIADPAQRRMMFLMPIMFTWFFLKLPSGLVLYWLVNNLLGIVQQYLVNKEADARKEAAVTS